MNAAEQNEIVETVVVHAADMQFLGQTHLIRHRHPIAGRRRARSCRRSSRSLLPRFQVRLPEIRAVLVNLVTSVVGRRPALP